MPLRFALAILFFASFANAVPAKEPAKSKPAASKSTKKIATTWNSLIDYALKNGIDRPLKAPLSRKLGFDSDLVPTKAMRVKAESSHDKFDHSIYVSYDVNSEGKTIPLSVVLSKTMTTRSEAGLHVRSFIIRVDPAGKVLNALRTSGLRGNVEQTVSDPSETSIKSDSEYEMTYFLKSIRLETLSTK